MAADNGTRPQVPAAFRGQVARSVDATGLRCPLPLLRLKVALQQVADGELVEVLATDPGSVADFQSFARLSGNAIVHRGETAGHYLYLVRKNAANAEGDTP